MLLGNALKHSEQNHSVVSQNIANVNTPGYRTNQLSFEHFLKKVSDGSAEHAFLENQPVTRVEGLMERADGNNVDIDQQLAALKKNSLLFQTYSQLLAAKMSTYRKAISG